MIDAHCHLERQYYGNDIDKVIDRAKHAGVTHIITVGASQVCLGAQEAIALAMQHDNIFATAGIHPHEAHLATQEALDEIETHLQNPMVVALGEIGLDFFYDHAPKVAQEKVLRYFLDMAKRHNIPVMLHVRDAHKETLALIDDIGLPEACGIVHCFSAGPTEARAYLERGMYLSIPGIVTFNKADALRDAVAMAPLDRLLVETDAPYLSPVPHRGKTNEPAFVVETAKRIASIKNISIEVLTEATVANTRRAYRLGD